MILGMRWIIKEVAADEYGEGFFKQGKVLQMLETTATSDIYGHFSAEWKDVPQISQDQLKSEE